MWEFTHEETIEAGPEVVFALITDLPNYRHWNPFLVEAGGDVSLNGVVKGKSYLGWTTTPYQHRIFELIENQSLCWRDFGFAAKLVCGERSRFVEAVDGKTRFTCHLKLTGPFAGMINILFGNGLRNGVVAEAQALKIEAEKS